MCRIAYLNSNFNNNLLIISKFCLQKFPIIEYQIYLLNFILFLICIRICSKFNIHKTAFKHFKVNYSKQCLTFVTLKIAML